MRHLKLRHWAALACCGVSWASLPPAAIGGQGNGDYDGDYDVDASDFLNWAGCMTGEQGGFVEPWAPCAAFDFDGDNDVDVQDFAQFQSRFLQPLPPGCTPAPPLVPGGLPGRYYVQTVTAQASIGVKVSITPHARKLCGAQGATADAFSAVHAGVTHFDSTNKPLQWAQLGYVKHRIQNGTIVFEGIYAETCADVANIPIDYDVCIVNFQHPQCQLGQTIGPITDTALPDTTYVYTCYKIMPNFATWRYEVDTTVLHNYWNLKIAGMTGTHINLTTELLNLEDDCPGTSTTKCTFSTPKYRSTTPLWGWAPLGIVAGDKQNMNSTEWGLELWNDGIRMWDKFPN